MKRGLRPAILAPLCCLTLALACSDDGTGTSASDTGDSGETMDADSGESMGESQGDGDPTTGDGDPTTGDGDPTTGDGDPTTGDGDGDPGTGDGDPTTGDGDGDPTTGDGDGDPGVDTDMDGVNDNADNCPNDPNPNQLDFDNDNMGNVCDPLVFAMGGGTLMTTATASAGGDSCDIPIDLEIVDGEVIIQMDDDANIADVEFVEFVLNDTPDYDCHLTVFGFINVDVVLSISDFLIANGGGPFPTSVPHNQNDHDNGILDGDQDMEHPIQVTGILTSEVNNDGMPSMTMIDYPGQTPPAAVLVTNAGDNLDLTFSDPNFVVLDETIMSMDLPVDVDLVLAGLEGTITMTP